MKEEQEKIVVIYIQDSQPISEINTMVILLPFSYSLQGLRRLNPMSKVILSFVPIILILVAQSQPIVMHTANFAIASSKFNSKDIYNSLLESRLSKLSEFYGGNSSLPGYETYEEVLNGTYSNYSIYSWMLLIDCERAIFSWNITTLVKNIGENETANMMLNFIEGKLRNIDGCLQETPKTIACVEWFSLASRNFIYGKRYFSFAEETYGREDFNATFAFLTQTYVYLCKAEDEVRIASERIKEPATTYEYENIELAMEKLSSKLINEVNNSFRDVSGVERSDLANYSKRVLSTANWYYENGSYYFALMYGAESKALLEYAYTAAMTNRSEALAYAEKFVQWAEGNLTKVYVNVDVDAPLAEYNFELAKLYLQDALVEEEDYAAILLADAASQSALIASEQAKQALRIISEVQNLEKTGEGEPWWEKISIWDLAAFVGGLIAIPTAIYLIFIRYGRKILRFKRGGRRK